MTQGKLQDLMNYPPKGLRAERAAAYLGFSESAFLRMVDDGRMPQPVRIQGIAVWDRLDLDAAFENLKDTGAQNTVHRILRERRNAKKLSLPQDRKG